MPSTSKRMFHSQKKSFFFFTTKKNHMLHLINFQLINFTIYLSCRRDTTKETRRKYIFDSQNPCN